MATSQARGVVTNAIKAKLGNRWNGGPSMTDLSYFKIGEGGWELVGGVKKPKSPDPSRTDVEATGTAPLFLVQKTLEDSDVSDDDAGVLTIVCGLDMLEGNDDGTGANPEFYELGVFDADGTMVLYVTFPEEVKNSGKTIEHVLTFTI